MANPSDPRAAIPKRAWREREAIDVLAAIGLAAALTLLVRSRPSSMHLSPYFVPLPLVFSPLVRRSRWSRVGFVALAGIAAAIFVNLALLH